MDDEPTLRRVRALLEREPGGVELSLLLDDVLGSVAATVRRLPDEAWLTDWAAALSSLGLSGRPEQMTPATWQAWYAGQCYALAVVCRSALMRRLPLNVIATLRERKNLLPLLHMISEGTQSVSVLASASNRDVSQIAKEIELLRSLLLVETTKPGRQRFVRLTQLGTDALAQFAIEHAPPDLEPRTSSREADRHDEQRMRQSPARAGEPENRAFGNPPATQRFPTSPPPARGSEARPKGATMGARPGAPIGARSAGSGMRPGGGAASRTSVSGGRSMGAPPPPMGPGAGIVRRKKNGEGESYNNKNTAGQRGMKNARTADYDHDLLTKGPFSGTQIIPDDFMPDIDLPDENGPKHVITRRDARKNTQVLDSNHPRGRITLTDGVTVKELAEKLDVKVSDLMKHLLMKKGLMVSINQPLGELALEVARELGVEAVIVSVEEAVAMKALERTEQNVFQGRAEVRDTFKIPKVGTIAGCMVVEGVIPRTATVRLLRQNRVIYEGRIGSLRHLTNDVAEVRHGFECGIGIERFQDIRVGDVIEAFNTVRIEAALA